MLRQSSSRNYRSKKLRPRHTLQAFLLFAVGIWIVYQLARSYGKRRVVVVEPDDRNAVEGGEASVRRRLGRKGFAGHASDADIVGVDDVASQSARWDAASSDDPLSKAEDREGDGDGDVEDQGADEDDGADDADDGLVLAGDEEDDDRDLLLLSQNSDSEDELKNVIGESDRATLFGNGAGIHEPKESNRSAVPRAKAVTGRVQDAAAGHQTNATDGAAEGRASATPLIDSPLKNASSVNQSLHDSGTAGDAATAEKMVASNGFAVREESEKLNVSVEDNSVAGHGISS